MNKRKYIFAVFIVLLLGFFLSNDFAYAACCVNGNVCSNPSPTDNSCLPGYNWYSLDCYKISSCPSYTGDGSACPECEGLLGVALTECMDGCEAGSDTICRTGCEAQGLIGTALTDCIDTCVAEGTAGNGNQGGTSTGAGTTSTTFPNPLGSITTIQQLLGSLLGNLMGIIAILAVIFIVIGGIMYIASGGNETAITRAKKTITAAVIGLAIALAAPTFLKEIYSILGKPDPGIGGIGIKNIAVNVLNLLLSIIGILGIISLVIGGGMYLTAYGDEKRLESAKKIVTYAVIGIVVALAALVIVRQVGNILGANFT